MRELALAGRFAEAADVWSARPREQRDDTHGQALSRTAAALVASHLGEHAEAERLAREALILIEGTDSPKLQGDVYYDLAVVLAAAGRRDEAVAAWHEALDRYERKGVVPLARQVSERLASLPPA